MTTFPVYINNVYATLGSAYTAASGSLVLASGQGAQFGSSFPIRVTVITAATYQTTAETLTVFSVTGRTADTLTGVTAIEGSTDRNYAIGDIVEIRWTAGDATLFSTSINAIESAPYAVDGLVVHLAGTETITGAKTFSSVPTWPAQTANRIFAGPSSAGPSVPTFRALVIADLPTSIPNANLANASVTISSHALALGGSLNLASGDISGLATSATTDTTNASNITSGTLGAARLPNPSATTLGGIQSAAAVSHQWIASISTSGVPTLSQPVFTDISGTIAVSQIPVGIGYYSPAAVKTANYTAAVGDLVPVDTTSGSVTITLPTAPADKSRIAVKQVTRGGSNTVTINCGGSDVFNKTGGATSATLTLLAQGIEIQYQASGAIWYVIAQDVPLAQIDTRYLQIANNLSDVTAATARTNLGLGSIATVNSPVPIGNGGTGQASAAAAYNALSPMATLGDIEYESGANTAAALAGNISATPALLSQTGTGSVSAAPAWATLGPNIAISGSSLRSRVPLYSALSAGTAVANSVALTSIFAGVATSQGSLTIPANTLIAGSLLVFKLFGTWGETTGSPTILMKITLGGTVIGQIPATATGASAQSGLAWGLDKLVLPGFQVQSIGSSGKIIGGLELRMPFGVAVTLTATGTASVAPSQVTINTTTSLAIDVQVQWGTANAANTFQLLGGSIYLDY